MPKHAPFKVAAVQASPVFLDTAATVDKACRLIRESAALPELLAAQPPIAPAPGEAGRSTGHNA